MRAFVAIPMPEAVLPGLLALQEPLRAGRLVPEENLHLTLAFLGDTDIPALEALHEELETLAVRPFDLRLAGLDIFGGDQPSVLFIRAQGEGLKELQKSVMRAIRRAGIELPRARFAPHVTLARFNRPGPEDLVRIGRYLQAHGDAALFPFRVTGFGLYRSDLHRDGARHELLAAYP